jgi:thioredoxin 1
MPEPKIITSKSEFDALLASTEYVVVDFHATWCAPCHAIAPTFAKLAEQHSHPGVLAFAKVDVDAVPQVAQANHVTAMPTFLFFQGGNPYSGKSMIRGADPKALMATVQEIAKLATKEAPVKEDVIRVAEEHDTETISGGYTMHSGRSDWKTSLRG